MHDVIADDGLTQVRYPPGQVVCLWKPGFAAQVTYEILAVAEYATIKKPIRTRDGWGG